MNVTKVFQKIKNKGLRSIVKNIKREKCFIIIMKKYFIRKSIKVFDFSARKFPFPEI